MNEENMNNDPQTIINQCSEFLKRSSNRYATTIQRAVSDMRRYSGDFWDDGFITKYKRRKKLCLSLNNWCPLANAISSPISNSPWHIELCDKREELAKVQDSIDQIEGDSEVKSAIVDAFRKAVLTGYGFLVVSTINDELTGEARVTVESASHIDSVAIDPSAQCVDASDAEEGAIVNYMSLKKAKRLFGTEIVPRLYPDTPCTISFAHQDQWTIPPDSVAVVSYFTKNDKGTVDYYKIVGDKVVESVEMPIKFIPIVRIAGNEIFENNEINYNGIIQQTMSLELGANIAYSTLVDRVGRSAKANILSHVDAIKGLERNTAAIADDDSLAILWKGDHEPRILTESFQTGDLQGTISTCRTLMEDTLGIPLTGIVDQRERTATEILRQETSKESNTANYYNNAYKAVRTISRIIIELITLGNDLMFTLENGPAVITQQMKMRQELTAMTTIMTDEMKPIIAKYFADTLKNDLGDGLSKNIVANLPANIKFITDEVDPSAIHMMNQMQAQVDEAMNQIEAKNQEIEQLKQQLQNTQMSLLNTREQRMLDWNKFTVSEQNKMALETAKLGLDQQKQNDQASKNEADAILKNTELNIKAAEVDQKRVEAETDRAVEEQKQYILGTFGLRG